MGQNLNLELPSWAKKVNGTICVKSPLEMYPIKEGKDINFTHLCTTCSAGDCGSMMHYYYYGLNDFLSVSGDGHYLERKHDKFIENFPEYTGFSIEKNWKSISIDSTDKKETGSIKKFFDDVEKAATYKMDLVKDVCYELQFNHNGLSVNLIMMNNKTVLLYKLSEELGNKVPTLSNPNSYVELLGTVHRFGENFDLNSIKTNDVPSTNKSVFEALFSWVEALFILNKQELYEGKLYLRVKKY